MNEELEEIAKKIRKVIPQNKLAFVLVVDELTEEYHIETSICTVCVVKNLIDHVITNGIMHDDKQETKH